MRYTVNDLIEVQWYDVEMITGWVSQRACSIAPNTLVKAVGYFTYITDEFLIISPMIGLGKNTKRAKLSIPLGSVKKIGIVEGRSEWRQEKRQD